MENEKALIKAYQECATEAQHLARKVMDDVVTNNRFWFDNSFSEKLNKIAGPGSAEESRRDIRQHALNSCMARRNITQR